MLVYGLAEYKICSRRFLSPHYRSHISPSLALPTLVGSFLRHLPMRTNQQHFLPLPRLAGLTEFEACIIMSTNSVYDRASVQCGTYRQL
jgi:hypothetical protein